MTKRLRVEGESCATCVYCSDFREAEPEEPAGYCTHPVQEPHNAEYGGFWTETDSWCEKHKLRAREGA